MPEYLAPGVYVEETSFRAKTIEGVSTSTAAFVGPARFGPTSGEPELLTSFAEFERIYGGLDQLDYEPYHNYLAHAVRAFFEEGGRRLYVSRVYNPASSAAFSGHASATVNADGESATLRARYPGKAGNVPVTFTFRLGPNILFYEQASGGPVRPVLRGASEFDVVWVRASAGSAADPLTPSTSEGQLYWLDRGFHNLRTTFRLNPGSSGSAVWLDDLTGDAPSAGADSVPPYDVRILTVDVTVGRLGMFSQDLTYQNRTFHPAHAQSLSKLFVGEGASRATRLYVPLVLTSETDNGADIARLLLTDGTVTVATATESAAASVPTSVPLSVPVSLPAGTSTVTLLSLLGPATTEAQRRFTVVLEGGSDGLRPGASEYQGVGGLGDGDEAADKSGLLAIEDLDDVAIVAAPGSTFGYDNGYKPHAKQITAQLVSHAERMRYRVAVLDSANGQLVSQVQQFRAQFDSTHAAMYYPWIRIVDPVTRAEINLPPSGFMAGIYARNDVDNGVHKAPANEVVRGAVGLEMMLSQAQQDVLNPAGIDCLRFFAGAGIRVWGARTIASDPEWKYVNVRRYFAYLEHSIEKGTQWAVFMNNHDPLWAKVRRTVEDFLYNEWKSERLMGTKPEEAYFVRCDRSTMTQNDIDNGRLICLVGVAPVRPAEFVVFRIGQWTAGSKV